MLEATVDLPGGILAALVRPLITAFVEDLPLGEEPLAVDFGQLIFVMAETVEDAVALWIVVGVVEPVGNARGFIAVYFDDDVGNIVAGGAVAHSGDGSRLWHSGDNFFDRLTAFDVVAAVVEHAVFSECRHLEIGIVEIEREEISRLQVLDCGAIIAITADGAILRITAEWAGRHRHHRNGDERSQRCGCQWNCRFSHK